MNAPRTTRSEAVGRGFSPIQAAVTFVPLCSGVLRDVIWRQESSRCLGDTRWAPGFWSPHSA